MIRTERLELIPATVELTQAALEGRGALGAGLGVTISESWPPELLDQGALEYMAARLGEGADQQEWWLYFVVLAGGPDGRVLIGSAGYKGPPTAGQVEIGYGIVSDYQRQGYASEAVRGLVARAFAIPDIHRVIAETLPELEPSIGVLRRCGFGLVGEGSEPGVIRYELTRAGYEHERVAADQPE